MATVSKDLVRLRIVMIVVLIVTSFFFINAGSYFIGYAIYLAIGVLSLSFFNNWGKITRTGDLEGISDNWLKNAGYGVLFFFLTLLGGAIFPGIGTIGIPSVPASVASTGRFIVINILAPLFETVFLVVVLIDLFDNVFKFPKWLSITLSAFLSSLFHYNAYGANLAAANGSFLTAFVMFWLFGYVAEKQNDITGAWVWHMLLNIWISTVKLAIVFLGGVLINAMFG